MPTSAINLKSIGYNLTVLADDFYLSEMMKKTEEFLSEAINELDDEVRWDLLIPMMLSNLKSKYDGFLKNPLNCTAENPEWTDFVTESIGYFFIHSYMNGTPVNLVHIDSFEKAITKGIYANLSKSDKPDLVQGIDYIEYVRV